MLKIAVIGVGHLGKEHTRLYHQLPGIDLVAVVDINQPRAREIARQYKTTPYFSHRELFHHNPDAVSLVTPTTTHYLIAEEFIKRGIHTFIEKPMTQTLGEARKIVYLTEKNKVIVQVGHIERFNPALRVVIPYIKNPRFIECHRLAPFSFRSIDIDVILDLMIHDIDIILSLNNNVPLKRMEAIGVNIISDQADLANVRLVFQNGCVANITASRVSDKLMRKLRVFTRDTYISVDYLIPEARIFRKKSISLPPQKLRKIRIPQPQDLRRIMLQKFFEVKQPQIEQYEPLRKELESFTDCIRREVKPVVTAQDGLRALELAHQIRRKIGLTTK